jgi:hypothetical protein
MTLRLMSGDPPDPSSSFSSFGFSSLTSHLQTSTTQVLEVNHDGVDKLPIHVCFYPIQVFNVPSDTHSQIFI